MCSSKLPILIMFRVINLGIISIHALARPHTLWRMCQACVQYSLPPPGPAVCCRWERRWPSQLPPWIHWYTPAASAASPLTARHLVADGRRAFSEGGNRRDSYRRNLKWGHLWGKGKETILETARISFQNADHFCGVTYNWKPQELTFLIL